MALDLSSILERHTARHEQLPPIHKQFIELGEAIDTAIKLRRYGISEHLTRERNRLLYEYILPDEVYSALPKSITSLYKR